VIPTVEAIEVGRVHGEKLRAEEGLPHCAIGGMCIGMLLPCLSAFLKSPPEREKAP